VADFETMPVGTAAVLVEAMGKLSFHAGIFKEQAKTTLAADSRQWREEEAAEAFDLASKIQQLLVQTAHVPQS
jgi:hypothetical protein